MRQSIIEKDIKELGAIILNYAGSKSYISRCRSPVYVYASIYLQHSVLQFLKTTEFAWRIHSKPLIIIHVVVRSLKSLAYYRQIYS